MGRHSVVSEPLKSILRGPCITSHEGTVADLRGQAQLLVRAHPLEQTQRLAEKLCGTEHVQVMDGALVLATDPAQAPEIVRVLVTVGVALSELRPVKRSLEAAFMELTKWALRWMRCLPLRWSPSNASSTNA